MEPQNDVSRRTVLRGSAAAGVAGLSVVSVSGPARAFPAQKAGAEVLPWLDQPEPVPPPAEDVVGNLLQWEELDSWLTPVDEFFTVSHYGEPDLARTDWRLLVDGLVSRPASISFPDLRAMPRNAVDFTLECSGNTGLPFFVGGIGNARWGGTPLHLVLEQAKPHDAASEVVFWGADRGEVTIGDNSGITGGGRTGAVKPDDGGGLDLTITEQFARSMSLEQAMSKTNLLCYEMNGVPLPREHGAPVRLIAPGWYGVANVKWLTRIELTDQRFAGRFMARDYVTVREEEHGGETVWTFKTVGHDRLKSAPAKVTRSGQDYTIMGAAWGAPIASVEVRVDDGPWQPARLHRPFWGSAARRRSSGYSWRFWTVPWPSPGRGEHTVTSRAMDEHGNVQPEPDDPVIANRVTYWENNAQITRRVAIP